MQGFSLGFIDKAAGFRERVCMQQVLSKSIRCLNVCSIRLQGILWIKYLRNHHRQGGDLPRGLLRLHGEMACSSGSTVSGALHELYDIGFRV